MSDFGVIICTCRFDFFLAKACVASVRKAMGDVPITLFMDDNVDARALAKEYNLNLMYRRDLADSFLRDHNTGWGLPKVSLFWVSPYERFLYLDCDTIMWGDIGTQYLQGEWDMVIDAGDSITRPWVPGVATEAWINKEYFNSALMEQTFPQFPWRKYMPAYFCTGAYASRRNVISLDEYKSLVETMKRVPGLFPIGEMGFLNYLIFTAVEQGRLKVERRPYELLCDYTNMQTLPQRFHLDGNGPVVKGDDIRILHFTDPKPVTSSYGFHAPFDFFRKQVAKKLSAIGRIMPGVYIWFEQLEWRLTKAWRHSKLTRFHRYIRPLLFWKRRSA